MWKGSFNKAVVTATSSRAVAHFPIEKVASVEEDSRDGNDEASLTVHTTRGVFSHVYLPLLPRSFSTYGSAIRRRLIDLSSQPSAASPPLHVTCRISDHRAGRSHEITPRLDDGDDVPRLLFLLYFGYFEAS